MFCWEMNRCYLLNRVTPGKDNTFLFVFKVFTIVLHEIIEIRFKRNRSLHVQFAMGSLAVIKGQMLFDCTLQIIFASVKKMIGILMQ